MTTNQQQPEREVDQWEPDWIQACALEDVGGGDDYAAVLALSSGGCFLPILLSRSAYRSTDGGSYFDPWCADAPHEQYGPLPLKWQQRMDDAFTPRCGRPTKSGRACRSLVPEKGCACAHHRTGQLEMKL